MFGYIKPFKAELKVKEWEAYQGIYCGLCKQLAQRYGLFARMTLNYDFVFLAMMDMALREQRIHFCQCNCITHPFKKRTCCQSNQSLELCCDIAMLFVGFFGYYPILKGKLEKIKKRSMEYLSKFSIFNLAMILNYLVIIYLFGIQDILEDVGPLGKFSVVLLLLMGNVVFFVYDIALSRIITAYRMVLRKKIFRRVGQG